MWRATPLVTQRRWHGTVTLPRHWMPGAIWSRSQKYPKPAHRSEGMGHGRGPLRGQPSLVGRTRSSARRFAGLRCAGTDRRPDTVVRRRPVRSTPARRSQRKTWNSSAMPHRHRHDLTAPPRCRDDRPRLLAGIDRDRARHRRRRRRLCPGGVYSAPAAVGSGFDFVFTGIGALGWLPDVARWARTVAELLRPGGRLFMREGHPMLLAFDVERTDEWVLRYPYFEQPEPGHFDLAGTYVDAEAKFNHTQLREWSHGVGDVITAVLAAGL